MNNSHKNVISVMAIAKVPVSELCILSLSVIFIFHYTYFSMLSIKCKVQWNHNIVFVWLTYLLFYFMLCLYKEITLNEILSNNIHNNVHE